MRTVLSRWMCAVVAATFLGSSLIVPAAQAGMIGTQSLVDKAQVEQQRTQVKSLLARADVQEQLVAWGVNPADAQARVDSLSPTELNDMALKMDALPAGGNVLGVLVFLFLVLLVTDVLGFTDIFPFVKKPNQR